MADDDSFESVYTRLEGDKQPYIRAAKECADLTIPSQFPSWDGMVVDELMLPYTDLGSRGVNNLASKLMLSLFPLDTPFFELAAENELELIQILIQDLGEGSEVDNAKEILDFWFDSIERLISKQIDKKGMRRTILQTLLQLLITGNCLLVFSSEGKLKLFKLYDYVVKRDIYGTPLFICIKQVVRFDELNDELRDIIYSKIEFKDDKKEIAIYTAVRFEDKKYHWNMEVDKKKIYDEDTVYDLNPFLPVRIGDTERDYSFSFVYEQALSDLTFLNKSIEKYRQIIAAISRTILFNDPLGGNNIQDIANAEDLDIISGRADYITTMQIDKRVDLASMLENIETLKRDVQLQFLMSLGVQRQAERVTAYEIHQLASNLNESLGGLYSDLVSELQQPLLDLIAMYLADNDELPDLNNLDVKPVVTAGLSGIGRNIEYQSMLAWLQNLPEMSMQFINWEVFTRRSARLAGVEVEGMIKTSMQVEQERQQAMMEQMAMQSAAPIANNATKPMAEPMGGEIPNE